jgi:hypothetical protein
VVTGRQHVVIPDTRYQDLPNSEWADTVTTTHRLPEICCQSVHTRCGWNDGAARRAILRWDDWL